MLPIRHGPQAMQYEISSILGRHGVMTLATLTRWIGKADADVVVSFAGEAIERRVADIVDQH